MIKYWYYIICIGEWSLARALHFIVEMIHLREWLHL